MKTKSLTKVTLLSIFTMSVISAVTLNSCQKENIKPKIISSSSKSAGVSNIEVFSSTIINEANNILFAGSDNAKGLVPGGVSPSCATVTYDTTVKPYTIIYNYGSSCTGTDGKTRSGIISMTYDNKDIRVVNNTITISFQNYAISGITTNGSIYFQNNGPDTNGNQVIGESGSIVATNQSENDTLNINYAYEWLAGEFSSPASNWQFSITGTVHDGTTTGKTADEIITSALIKNSKDTIGCNFYIQGTKQVTETGQPTIYTDYGNPGGCSGMKSVTQNGVTTVVSQ